MTHPATRAQELMAAAVLSQDPVMLSTYKNPPTMLDPDADMHTLTASSIHPHIFKDAQGNPLPRWQWVNIAKDKSLISSPKSPRDQGKTTNFGVLYSQTAASLSALNFVPVSETEKWVKGHEALYKGFHAWAKEQKKIGEARGWAQTKWFKRLRYVNESNAKGAKESPGIMAVNFAIQGCSADMTKAAIIKCARLIRTSKDKDVNSIKIIGQVHDELVFEGPGHLKLDLANSKYKDGVIVKPKWLVPDSVLEWVELLKQTMIDVETECFDGVLIGRTGEPTISQFWSK
jgi:hypothetical protein